MRKRDGQKRMVEKERERERKGLTIKRGKEMKRRKKGRSRGGAKEKKKTIAHRSVSRAIATVSCRCSPWQSRHSVIRRCSKAAGG